MNCEYTRVRISSLLDRELGEGERRDTLAHLEDCGSCRDRYQSLERQRLALRSMEAPAVPAVLTHRLRVLASHERLRRIARSSVSVRLRHMSGRIRLYMDNMMRPVALPVGGGLLSAVLLFGILAPGLIFTRNLGFDPSVASVVTLPQMVTLPEGKLVGGAGEVVSVQMAGFVSVETVGAIPSSSDSTLIELTVDRYGHILDWRMVQGKLTPEFKNLLVFSSFNPGTYYGDPTGSTVLVALHTVRSATRS